MTGRTMAVAVAAMLAAQPALAQRARERSAQPRASAPSVAAGHHSRAPRAVPRGSHSSRPALTGAQARHPRAGTGRPYRGGAYYGYHGHYHGRYPYYGYPYWGYGYWGYPYYWDYPYWGWSVGYGYPSYVGLSYYSDSYPTASLRLLVHPREAKVYVDGYYAGIVDDFDGVFQRLEVAPGRHEIVLKLTGFVTQRFKVFVALGQTVKIRHEMVAGGGEAEEELEGWAEAERADRRYEAEEERYEGQPSRDEPPPRPQPGTLSLDVRPLDASVYVDGRFLGTGDDARRVPLPPGPHRVEVVKPGYRLYERDVEIEPGRRVELVIELERS